MNYYFPVIGSKELLDVKSGLANVHFAELLSREWMPPDQQCHAVNKLVLRFYATFYVALSILSVLYCVYDFIINK